MSEEVLKFIDRIENEIRNQTHPSEDLEPYFTPNKRGEIEFDEEIKDIGLLCEKAKANGYFLKCLDR